MYGVSSSFRAALAGSNQRVITRVITSGGVELSVAGGNVSMDSRRDISRTASLELLPTGSLSADDVYRLVSSPSLELTVSRGLLIDGQPEFVPLGVFSTDEAEVSKSASATVTWKGSDRSKRVARNRFLDPYQIVAGTTLAAAGSALLKSRFPGIATDFGNVTATVSATITYEAGANSDPWKSARELFAAHGYDLAFDGLGVARARIIPDPASVVPVFDFGSGETSIVLGGSAKASLESVYTGVVATGEGTDVDVPVRAIVWDTDPASPTFWQGGAGQRPYFYSSPLLTTEEAAAKAASTILARVKGRSEQLAWPAIVNPALEPLDVVAVTFGSQRTVCVIDSATIPLKASEPMSANARATVLL